MPKKTLGVTEARLFTPPLRKLTPRTSRGFDVIEFAQSIGIELLPWQKWFLIHALEVLKNGEFRFRTILLLISRQNGKTTIARILTLWMMSTQAKTMVLGTSVAQELAREPWSQVVDMAEDLNIAKQIKRGSIDTSLVLNNGSRYKVGTSGRRGGRSLSVDLLLIDELREHLDWDGWNALTATTTARPNPLTLALSNAGDDRSVVLNSIRASALAGEDQRVGVFEWSGPEGCELDDEAAIAQANPSLGHTITLETLATKRNTLPANGYRTEHLCQRVESENPAVDKEAWTEGADASGSMDALRAKVVLGIDVALDGQHVSLVAAAPLSDGRVRVETVAAFESLTEARDGLADLVARVKPKAVGWLPNGPAAALAAELSALPKSVEIAPGEVPALCQGFAFQVESRRLLHSEDPMLTAQVLATSRTSAGDGWRFTRKGVGNCDAAYAAGIAVHIVKTKMPNIGRPRILVVT